MSYNGNDFMKASVLAYELNFEEYNVSVKHMENSFVLFMDQDNGTWSIEATYKGGFNICYEGEKIAVVDELLKSQLEEFIAEELEKQEMDGKLSDNYHQTRDYLFRNYGFGKN